MCVLHFPPFERYCKGAYTVLVNSARTPGRSGPNAVATILLAIPRESESADAGRMDATLPSLMAGENMAAADL